MPLSKDTNNNTIQGFSPTKVVTFTGGSTVDVSGYAAIRVSAPAEVYYNTDSALKVTIPIGVTVTQNIQSITFTTTTNVEVMI